MQVNVVDSQSVKRGDILVVIDETDAKLAHRQAQADLARAQAQVIAAISDVERTGVDLSRRDALVASGSVSGDELTNAKNRASSARAALDAARAQVVAAPHVGRGRAIHLEAVALADHGRLALDRREVFGKILVEL